MQEWNPSARATTLGRRRQLPNIPHTTTTAQTPRQAPTFPLHHLHILCPCCVKPTRTTQPPNTPRTTTTAQIPAQAQAPTPPHQPHTLGPCGVKPPRTTQPLLMKMWAESRTQTVVRIHPISPSRAPKMLSPPQAPITLHHPHTLSPCLVKPPRNPPLFLMQM